MTDLIAHAGETKAHLMFEVAGNIVAVAVNRVRDVLFDTRVTRVPLACEEVYGILNLRGRIVTALSSRSILKLPPRDQGAGSIVAIVVDYSGEDYALIVDRVIETVDLPETLREEVPRTMDRHWRMMSEAIYKTEDRLVPVMDLGQMFSFLDEGIVQVS